MRGTLNGARQVVVDTLDGVPFLSAWAFEYTPPSSEAADDTYLRHVRDADVVIWLAGSEVTQPVVNEVREALAHCRRLIIIRYGTTARSPECEALLAEVGLRAKYADAADDGELRAALELAMGDEIVRAMRGAPDLGRLALIDALGRASLARCARRWQAPGLPRDEALALAGDPAIGAPPAGVLPDERQPVVLLSAEMGSGKSLAAERHLQRAIEAMLERGNAPIPVWLTARQAAAGGLLATAHAACGGLGNPLNQGAAVVVDGLDEAGVRVAEQLLDEARDLTATWPLTTVLLTTRPLPALMVAEEHRSLPALTDDEVLAITSLGAGEDVPVGVVSTLPRPVRSSLNRPLFALLYGLARREGTATPRSRGDLLAFLGQRARVRAGADAEPLLRRLAVASVLRELGPVPAGEVASIAAIEPLLASGLVVARPPGGLALGLPVIAQWFAAQALLLGEITVGELLAAQEDLDLWRYPLAIAVATASFDDATALLAPIMRRVPGFAFVIIEEALATATLEGIGAPPWRQAGTEMRDAMEALADGLGDLAAIALPLADDGRLAPLGVDSSGEHVDYAFWVGGEPREPIFHLRGRTLFDFDPDLTMRGFAAIGRGSAWAWRWARDRLRHALRDIFDQRALPYGGDGPIAKETLWSLALRVAGAGALHRQPVEIAPLIARLEQTVARADRDGAHRVVIVTPAGEVDARRALDLFQRVGAGGVDAVAPPHPPSDQRPRGGGGWIGLFFSEQRLLEHVTSVYEQALIAYADLVQHSFGALADRLALNVTLPARYVGVLDPGDTADGPRAHIPTLEGLWEALPAGEASQIAIAIHRARSDHWHDRDRLERLRSQRPHAARWITTWSGGGFFRLGVTMPSTELAYEWLWRDLAHTQVVTGMRPSPYRTG